MECSRAALLAGWERVEDGEDNVDNDENEDDDEQIDLREGDHRSLHAPEVFDNGEDNQETPMIHRGRASQQRTLLTFKDVEVSLKKFNGDNHTNVRRWLRKLEETAELCEWNNMQKVAYAKRLLDASAELFVEYEDCINTGAKLKKVLKEEFEQTVDSLQVHQGFSERKKKLEEGIYI